jgi:hypothetical protein
VSKSSKPVGRPRNTPEGGKNVLFYLPKAVIEYIKSQGGSSWIRRKALEEMKIRGKEKGGNKIMEIRAFAGRSRTNGLYRIATKGIYTKKE